MNQAIAHTQILKIKSHLKRGGIIAYATESCFGLGVLCNHPKAITRLIKLKKRSTEKGLIVIGNSISQFNSLILPLNTTQRQFLTQQWPAAKTYLSPAKKTIYPLLRGKRRKKIAIRIPDHPQARFLCRAIGQPLVSTSANLTGKKNCTTIREVKRQFPHHVLIINGMVGKNKAGSQIFELNNLTQIR